MDAQVPALSGLVCSDDGAAVRAVGTLMHASGFDEVAFVDNPADALLATTRRRPHAVVVDLAACGPGALRAVPALIAANPGGGVVAISGFTALERDVVRVGGAGLVTPGDYRPLRAWLQAVRANVHAGGTCTCCPPGGGGDHRLVLVNWSSSREVPVGAALAGWDSYPAATEGSISTTGTSSDSTN